MDIDKEVIVRAKEGEERAMSEIYLHYKDYVLRSAWMMLGKREEAEDVMENVFFKVFTRLHTFNMEKDFKPWLSRIIVNESRNLFKKKKSTYDNQEGFIDGASSDDISLEKRMDIRHKIHLLEHDVRELLMMRFFHDLTLEEIARIKRITLNNAKVKIHRAVKKLKELMQSDDEG